jgi:uncharacterized protein
MSLPPWVRPAQGGATIEAFVRPRAAKDGLAGVHGTGLRVKVKAPPVEGRANRAVEKLFADLLGLPRSAVEVVTGELSRHKTIRVSGMSPEDVTIALDGVLSSRAHEPGEEAR